MFLTSVCPRVSSNWTRPPYFPPSPFPSPSCTLPLLPHSSSSSSPSVQFRYPSGYPLTPLSGAVILWPSSQPRSSAPNFFHFVADSLPALLVALRGVNGTEHQHAHVMGNGWQVRGEANEVHEGTQ